MNAWQELLDEIARWRDEGRVVDFWWRDDDAHEPDPALDLLTSLAERHAVPLALAVIPAQLQTRLADACTPMVSVLQHGVDHRSRAVPGQKKTEFAPEESVGDAVARLASGWSRMHAALGERCLKVLVPPWNRLSAAALLPALAASGYRGLSTFGARPRAQAADGITWVNTHVDIIDWRGSRGFAGEEAVLGQALRHLQARRTGQADALEPTGWLTHHLVHDEACWRFMQRLFETTIPLESVVWRSAASLYTAEPRSFADTRR